MVTATNDFTDQFTSFVSTRIRLQSTMQIHSKSYWKDFCITPHIYYAWTMINYIWFLLLLKTIETSESIKYLHW